MIDYVTVSKEINRIVHEKMYDKCHFHKNIYLR